MNIYLLLFLTAKYIIFSTFNSNFSNVISLIQFVFPFQEQFHLWVTFKQRRDCFLRPNTWWQAFCYSLLWNLAVSGVQLHQWDTFKLTTLINGPSTFTKILHFKYYNNLRRTVSTVASKHKMDPKNGATPGRISTSFTIKRHRLIVSKLLLKRMLIMLDNFFLNTYPNMISFQIPKWLNRQELIPDHLY